MKWFAWVAAVLLVLALAASAYFYSAWRVANDAAVAIAAGDNGLTVDGSAWALGSALPHERLRVQTHSGWAELSGHLMVPFTVTDSVANRSVDFGVDVEFTRSGWHVVGAGDLGG